MPKISEHLLEASTVAMALTNAWRGTLPKSVAENNLVEWILSYGEQQEINFNQNELTSRPMRREDSNELRKLAIIQMGGNLLKRRLPLYFESLFSFGRAMRATELALDDCETALGDGSFARAALEISRQPSRQNGFRARDSLERLAVEAIRRYRYELRRYESIWGIWTSEVSELMNLNGKIHHYVEASRPGSDESGADSIKTLELVGEMVRLQMRPSALPEALSAVSLRVASNGVTFSQSEPLIDPTLSLLGIILFASRGGRYDDYFTREMANAINTIGRAEYEKAIAPQIEAEERTLHQKYRGRDPFARFDPGKTPPTPKLIELAKENHLFGGRESRWLRQWKQRLGLNWSFELPEFEERLSDVSVRWETSRVDSILKRSVIENESTPPPPFSKFLQKTFERKWVQELAKALIQIEEKNRQIREPWNFDAFFAYVALIAQRMTKNGYSLKSPEEGRLQTLLEMALRGESLSSWEDTKW